MMCAVECDEAHAVYVNSLTDTLNESIVNLAMAHMSPPNKYVGVVKYLIRKSLIGIVKCGKSDLYIVILSEKFTDNCVKSVRINLCNIGVGFFMSEFIPDGYVNCFSHNRSSK